ncbi:MAG: hypothetical protein C4584_02650 [Armatimonadetes bacterium]|nr:MAG: hypothetical protein C4584_02650 [Armatimonadota bacterium]
MTENTDQHTQGSREELLLSIRLTLHRIGVLRNRLTASDILELTRQEALEATAEVLTQLHLVENMGAVISVAAHILGQNATPPKDLSNEELIRIEFFLDVILKLVIEFCKLAGEETRLPEGFEDDPYNPLGGIPSFA